MLWYILWWLIRRDFSFEKFTPFENLSGDENTHFIVGYPAGILIAEVGFYFLYNKDGYPLCRELRYLWAYPDKYANGYLLARIASNLRKHRDCPDRVWRRFKKWYNQQLRIHITQPWYQMALWLWSSDWSKMEPIYLGPKRGVKVYGYVNYAFEAVDRDRSLTLSSSDIITLRPPSEYLIFY